MSDRARSTLLHAASCGGCTIHSQPSHHSQRPQTGQHATQWEHGVEAGRLWFGH